MNESRAITTCLVSQAPYLDLEFLSHNIYEQVETELMNYAFEFLSVYCRQIFDNNEDIVHHFPLVEPSIYRIQLNKVQMSKVHHSPQMYLISRSKRSLDSE
jgi:hypothetical protein